MERSLQARPSGELAARSTRVEHIATDVERPIIATNAAMRGIDDR